MPSYLKIRKKDNTWGECYTLVEADVTTALGYTPLKEHQSLANYVTLNGVQTITAKKTIDTTSNTNMSTTSLDILHTGPKDGSSYADLMTLSGFKTSPYGFKFRTYGDGTAIIQSQRISGTEKFPLSLNPDGGNVLINGNLAATQNYVGQQISNIGVASTTSNGLMSKGDKTNLNTLVALLDDDDANTTIDTIKEVLNVFTNYPEGTNIANALSLKLDKTGGTITTGQSEEIQFTAYSGESSIVIKNSDDGSEAYYGDSKMLMNTQNGAFELFPEEGYMSLQWENDYVSVGTGSIQISKTTNSSFGSFIGYGNIKLTNEENPYLRIEHLDKYIELANNEDDLGLNIVYSNDYHSHIGSSSMSFTADNTWFDVYPEDGYMLFGNNTDWIKLNMGGFEIHDPDNQLNYSNGTFDWTMGSIKISASAEENYIKIEDKTNKIFSWLRTDKLEIYKNNNMQLSIGYDEQSGNSYISHFSDVDLRIGNSKNEAYVKFVEDIAFGTGGNGYITVDGEAEFQSLNIQDGSSFYGNVYVYNQLYASENAESEVLTAGQPGQVLKTNGSDKVYWADDNSGSGGGGFDVTYEDGNLTFIDGEGGSSTGGSREVLLCTEEQKDYEPNADFNGDTEIITFTFDKDKLNNKYFVLDYMKYIRGNPLFYKVNFNITGLRNCKLFIYSSEYSDGLGGTDGSGNTNTTFPPINYLIVENETNLLKCEVDDFAPGVIDINSMSSYFDGSHLCFEINRNPDNYYREALMIDIDEFGIGTVKALCEYEM